ncbi:MAG: competence/damage-inducible protein A [Synechococcus sp. SB0666_bin_14]|nr:competence/damage-inducible protein A [Synechococcus sp. SB0666_bin_14]MYA91036.1 competence/damage-inducible protein A [Synechococcus sp. SB0663_bin_10]MYG46761.1 competence/damage-inducible protein A [Synechococcus sp. SB0675_bin_6]MYJ59591.1 competence/damage-inducible protein A [Synechococcus sp. SB0672_bin_6]MYK92149.1 competence/damage-inducible protein A [Synechococcus sp. SB0669_bin_8]
MTPDPNHLGEGAEVLCIGSELLLGNILNSNARWLAEALAALGIPHFRQTVVGDNSQRLQEAVREASRRCRLLVTTGGLGPTTDDLTTQSVADCFGQPLELREDVLATVMARYKARGQSIPASNRKQALLPKGATVIPNPTGTAPGMIWEPRPGFVILTFPGVPTELHAMWRQTAVPWLQERSYGRGVVLSRILRFWGASESRLAEAAAAELAQTNPTVAPYAGTGEVKLRITACAETSQGAEALIAPTQARLMKLGGSNCYGCDEDSLASVVLNLLTERQQTVATAESCTGGGIAAALTAVPGSSVVVLGGIVAYANAVKHRLLGVSTADLERHGAVSEPVAKAMAAGARHRLGADWGVAVTGIAGPGGGSISKPVGLVVLAVSSGQGTVAVTGRFGASRGRHWIQAVSVGASLDLLRRQLLGLGLENTWG